MARRRAKASGRSFAPRLTRGCAAVRCTEASHKFGTVQINRDAIATKVIGSERRRIIGDHQHEDQDVFAQKVDSLCNGWRGRRGIDGTDEAIARGQMHEGLCLLYRSKHHVGCDRHYGLQGGTAREEGRQFFKRYFEIARDLSRPAEGWALSGKRRDMLVPKMQIDEWAARAKGCSVGQGNGVRTLGNLRTKDTAWRLAVLEYSVPDAEPFVDGGDESVQHRCTIALYSDQRPWSSPVADPKGSAANSKVRSSRACRRVEQG